MTNDTDAIFNPMLAILRMQKDREILEWLEKGSSNAPDVTKKKPLIVSINGVDGIGKQTITTLLFDLLRKSHYRCLRVSTPFYKSFWGNVIRRSLHGEWGDPARLDPYLASTLYTMDRITWLQTQSDVFEENSLFDIVLFDSNWRRSIIHQGAKILEPYITVDSGKSSYDEESVEAIRNYIGWLYRVEVMTTPLNGLLEIPFYLTRDSNAESIARQNYERMKKTRADVDALESNLYYQGMCVQWGEMLVSSPETYFDGYKFGRTPASTRNIEHFIKISVDYIPDKVPSEKLKAKLIRQAGERAAQQMLQYIIEQRPAPIIRISDKKD